MARFSSGSPPGGVEIQTGIHPRFSLPPPREAIRVEVDLDAIVGNARAVQERVGHATGVLAVLRADAYGHGLTRVAAALARAEDVAGFCVTSIADALTLSSAGIELPIVCVAPLWEARHADMIRRGIVPVVSSSVDLDPFARAARALGTNGRIHVKVDTGMADLGIRENEVDAFLAAFPPGLTVAGMCTDLACPEDDDVTSRQLEAFERVVARFRHLGHRPTMLHASSSTSIWSAPRSHFRHVRAGIALFGGDGQPKLRPTMKVVTAIAQLRVVEPDETVSIGGRWRAHRRTVVATLPIGYAHGYPRRLGDRGDVLVDGKRCPIIGAICMERMLVDVTDVTANVGDEAVLLGGQGDEVITALEIAQNIGGIVEEVLCGFSKTVPREYVRPGQRRGRKLPISLHPEW